MEQMGATIRGHPSNGESAGRKDYEGDEKKSGNLDFTKDKIEEIEIHYNSVISALEESGIVYGEACEEYLRQANELGFLMRDICVQLEKAGFRGVTREMVRDVLVEHGYSDAGPNSWTSRYYPRRVDRQVEKVKTMLSEHTLWESVSIRWLSNCML